MMERPVAAVVAFFGQDRRLLQQQPTQPTSSMIRSRSRLVAVLMTLLGLAILMPSGQTFSTSALSRPASGRIRRHAVRMQATGQGPPQEGDDGATSGQLEQNPGLRDRYAQSGATSRDGLIRGVAAVSVAALAGIWGGSPPQELAARAAEGSVRDEDLPAVAFKTKSGLRYYDVRKGSGPAPKWGQVAIIQYEGYVRASPFSRLVLFDDTYSRKAPYLVKHGNGRVIRGLDEGLHTMKLGGLRRIVVPLELGYTKTGLGPIPPNALRRKVLVRELTKAEQQEGEIVYDVELVSVYDDEADMGYYDDLTFDPGYLQVWVAGDCLGVWCAMLGLRYHLDLQDDEQLVSRVADVWGVWGAVGLEITPRSAG